MIDPALIIVEGNVRYCGIDRRAQSGSRVRDSTQISKKKSRQYKLIPCRGPHVAGRGVGI
jgi:hypothetical protein